MPFIETGRTNLERAANAVWGALHNAGKTFISIERVYVEGDAYEPFLARVIDNVARLRHGPPDGPGTVDIGAITSAEQVDVIEEHLRDAVAKGRLSEIS